MVFGLMVRIFLARRTRVVRISSYIGPKNVFKASAGGRLGHQAANHPWSALHVVKAAEKTAPMPKMLPKPKQ
jgi:hypothetical protein